MWISATFWIISRSIAARGRSCSISNRSIMLGSSCQRPGRPPGSSQSSSSNPGGMRWVPERPQPIPAPSRGQTRFTTPRSAARVSCGCSISTNSLLPPRPWAALDPLAASGSGFLPTAVASACSLLTGSWTSAAPWPKSRPTPCGSSTPYCRRHGPGPILSILPATPMRSATRLHSRRCSPILPTTRSSS